MKKSPHASTGLPLQAGVVLNREGGSSPASGVAASMSQGRSRPMFSRRSNTGLLLLGLGALSCVSACGSGGGGGGSAPGIPGQELDKPGGGTYFVDPNQGGSSTRLHLAEMFWARIVDVHDIDDQGEVDIVPIFRDFAINENIQSDSSSYRLETNPITQKTRLVILRVRGAPDTGLGTFESKLQFASEGLPPVEPKHDDGSMGDQYSFVARNATLVLRFDDMLDDDFEAQRDLAETVRIKAGYPPVTPFPARHLFDPNHGAVVGGEFHSTRVLIDLTVSESESQGMILPQPINSVGLPPSLTTTTSPNVSVRIPTLEDFGSGQFELLRALSGVTLAPFENGPVDTTSSTRDVVRAMRSGKPSDVNNGFMVDLSAPEILGGWAMRVDDAFADPQGTAGFDFLLDVTFTTVCRGAPSVGDVVSVGSNFMEVSQESAAPNIDGQVVGLRVRSLSDTPLPGTGSLLGNALFLSTFQPTDPVPSGCWLSFTPLPTVLPAQGVATNAEVLVRFSEPMDPASMSPFDNFYLVRGDSNSQVSATNLIVGELTISTDLKNFTFSPTQALPHDTNTAETYHARVTGPTDLAGNALAAALPAVNFEMEPTGAPVHNGGLVLRFGSTDELEPVGFPDLRGQFFFDFDRQVIRPRPAAFNSYPVDRINPVPSIMIPFPPGVQTPLSSLGSKLQTVWRYCDLGWQVLDETKYNVDVVGLSWAPSGGSVINDFFERFEIALAHSRRLPDESIDGNLLPKFENSGVSSQFSANILNDPLSPQKVVHPRSLGYQINGANLFLASSGTIMMPYPLNRGLTPTEVYTWRDTAVLAVAGPSGAGIPLDVEAGPPLGLEAVQGYVFGTNEVPSFGLPLLVEYRCFPSDQALGLNPLDISLAINSSAVPSFRAYSTGGVDQAGVTVRRNPDTEFNARGGFNPSSNPPGAPTRRSDENAFYIGQLDVVTRLSRVHSVWVNSGVADPNYLDPIVLPDQADQPAGTEIIIEYRGAEGFVLEDIDITTGQTLDEGLFPFDAQHLNAYGDIFVLTPDTVGNNPPISFNRHTRLGTPLFPGEVQYLNGTSTWLSDIDQIDLARYLQLRITFVSNIETSLSPELSAIGIAFAGQ